MRTASTQAKFDNIAVASQTKYYYFAGKRTAMRNPTGLSYIHGDHLGSAANTTGFTAPPEVPPAAPRRGGRGYRR